MVYRAEDLMAKLTSVMEDYAEEEGHVYECAPIVHKTGIPTSVLTVTDKDGTRTEFLVMVSSVRSSDGLA
jgi:hypothetical protein